MKFLTANGCGLPTKVGAASRKSDEFPVHHESLFNDPKIRYLTHKRGFSDEIIKSVAEAANSFEGLINGQGAHWNLTTHLWSTNGYGPEAGFSVAVIGGFNPFRGVGYMDITDVTFDVGLEELWTVMVWRLEADWVHYIIRADGVKFVDGIRNDAINTSWLTIGSGRFAIGGAPTGFSHLTFLPYLLDKTCSPETNRWQTSKNMVSYWPFDSDASDIAGGHNGVPVSTTFNVVGGQVGGFAEMNAISDDITVADNTELTPGDSDAFSFEFWIRSTSFAVSAAIAQKGLFSGAGYGFLLSAAGELEWALFGSVSGFRSIKCDPPFDGEWHQVVGSYDGLSKISLYCDGLIAASDVATTTGIDSTGDGLVFGGLIADFDDAKFFRSELSADEVKEHYICGLYRRRLPLPQSWSALPDINIWGEISACKELVVNGETSRQRIIQHGDANGEWVNNSREIPFTLDAK